MQLSLAPSIKRKLSIENIVVTCDSYIKFKALMIAIGSLAFFNIYEVQFLTIFKFSIRS